MNSKRILALLMALCMVLSFAACGESAAPAQQSETAKEEAPAAEAPAAEAPAEEAAPAVEDSQFFGPIYDDWSKMTDEELYALAQEEVKDGSAINIYATSSKMLKVKDTFEEAFRGFTV